MWTVCVTEFKVRVVVKGDRSGPPAATGSSAAGSTLAAKKAPAPQAASKRGSTKGKAKAAAVPKAPASRTISKAKPRGRGGAAIVSVPGMSMKEVASLNKRARAVRQSCLDSDSDDEHGYGLSGLKYKSEAFWERELL